MTSTGRPVRRRTFADREMSRTAKFWVWVAACGVIFLLSFAPSGLQAPGQWGAHPCITVGTLPTLTRAPDKPFVLSAPAGSCLDQLTIFPSTHHVTRIGAGRWLASLPVGTYAYAFASKRGSAHPMSIGPGRGELRVTSVRHDVAVAKAATRRLASATTTSSATPSDHRPGDHFTVPLTFGWPTPRSARQLPDDDRIVVEICYRPVGVTIADGRCISRHTWLQDKVSITDTLSIDDVHAGELEVLVDATISRGEQVLANRTYLIEIGRASPSFWQRIDIWWVKLCGIVGGLAAAVALAQSLKGNRQRTSEQSSASAEDSVGQEGASDGSDTTLT